MNDKTDNNTKITEDDFDKLYMSDEFDKRELFETEIKPLADRIFDLCAEHQIPHLVAFCLANQRNSTSARLDIVRSVHFPGPERTPAQMVAAESCLSLPNRQAAMSILYGIDLIGEADAVVERVTSGSAIH